ncbi:MAG: [protein-PII] uridylyltransferase [Ilumatobacteraceae bacterium]
MILAERERLLADESLFGRAWCETWTAAIDTWLVELYTNVFADHAGVCMLVVGGTGRREMAPHSDIDVMVVHRGSAEKIEPRLADLWYPIWDTGIHLGHAVRAANQQWSIGAEQLESATTMLSGRWIAGDQALADEVLQNARRSWRGNAGAWLSLLRERGLARHHTDGEVAFLLEPNLKEGRGGLRDMHELRWIDAAGRGIVPGTPAVLAAAYDTLLHARVELHRVAPIAGEILRLEDQDAIAASGHFGTADDLMAAVSSSARTLSWQFDRAWHAVARAEKGPVKPRPLASGVTLRNGEVELGVDVWPERDPTLMLQVAVGAARSQSPIATRALETLNERTLDWPQPWPTGGAEELVALLLEGPRAIPVLESLDQADLFTRMLPEWAPVRSRPQRNAYHRFTVDRHLWEAAAQAALLADRVSRPDLLVIGALLHDIGKGYPGDHTERGEELVAMIGPRMGFDDRDTASLVGLVRHHLLLPDVATRRDLDDPATIDMVAEAVGSGMFLDLLHALTEADSLATGSSAWSPWKAELVEELVERVRMRLGVADGADARQERRSPFPTAEILEMMGAGETAVDVDGSRIVVVNSDRPGTFARLAGVLALHGIDVIGARAHSDEQGMAASLFRTAETAQGADWAAITADIRRALAGELALSARLAERARTYRRRKRPTAASVLSPSVAFVDGASSNATVIEVRAPDSIGLLHRVAAALAEMGLDIRHATVQTIGPSVVDSFYVRTSEGAKVTDPYHRSEIERALLDAVGSPS